MRLPATRWQTATAGAEWVLPAGALGAFVVFGVGESFGEQLDSIQEDTGMQWSRLFPGVEERYRGPKIPLYFLVLVAVASTIRSLIHMFAADGGANSIAGIAVDVQGGHNIIAMFAQWGASQLILALIYWLVIVRYRFLVPAMLGVVVVEQLLRLGVGSLKPLEVIAAPPGAIGSQILLPLAVIALLWSLRSGTKAV